MARGAGARGSGFRLTALESFSGGLNLRSDQFNLAPNESPDLLNVVVDPGVGFGCAPAWTAGTRRPCRLT